LNIDVGISFQPMRHGGSGKQSLGRLLTRQEQLGFQFI
jgi:hypothetical protein